LNKILFKKKGEMVDFYQLQNFIMVYTQKDKSLKERFKLLILPIIILTTILVLFISFSEYQTYRDLKLLKRDIKVVENIRKLVSFIAQEREISIKYLNAKKDRRIKRELRKKISINNTRIKSLKKKMANFSQSEIEARTFLKNTNLFLSNINEQLTNIRQAVKAKKLTAHEITEKYTLIINQFIDTIAISSYNINNAVISKNIITYSIFLKYLDILHQRDIFIKKIIATKNKTDNEIYNDFLQLTAQKKIIENLANTIFNQKLLKIYQQTYQTKEVQIIENLSSKLEKHEFNIDINQRHLKVDFIQFYKKMKELDDFISKSIIKELNLRLDNNKTRIGILIIFFLVSMLILAIITHVVYHNLRELVFIGTIDIRGKILRVIGDLSIDTTKYKNEIFSLIELVSQFTNMIKITLLNIRVRFREVLSLSSQLSQNSETIVDHLQKQSKYFENVNFDLTLFLESIKNSEISFANLKEIIDDSSAKLNNLNLDVVYISYEVASLKELNKEIIQNREAVTKILQEIFDEISISPELKTKFEEINKIVSRTDEIIEIKEQKLTNLNKTALEIKHDAEINNANLSDILGVITILGFETKGIASDIDTTIKDNNQFIEKSKNMLEKSEMISSNVVLLNKYVIDLDREFNKFRF
jgi:hypothetical protein